MTTDASIERPKPSGGLNANCTGRAVMRTRRPTRSTATAIGPRSALPEMRGEEVGPAAADVAAQEQLAQEDDVEDVEVEREGQLDAGVGGRRCRRAARARPSRYGDGEREAGLQLRRQQLGDERVAVLRGQHDLRVVDLHGAAEVVDLQGEGAGGVQELDVDEEQRGEPAHGERPVDKRILVAPTSTPSPLMLRPGSMANGGT